MTNEELMALPDVTPNIACTEREVDGKKVRIPQMVGARAALYQQADDGIFVGADGKEWMTGWLHGQRVRRLA